MICKPGGLKTRAMCRYNEAAKLMRRTRMNSALRQSVTQIFEELGIHIDNLYKWRKAWQLSGEVLPVSEKDHNHKSSPLYQQRSPLVSKKPGGATDEQ